MFDLHELLKGIEQALNNAVVLVSVEEDLTKGAYVSRLLQNRDVETIREVAGVSQAMMNDVRED